MSISFTEKQENYISAQLLSGDFQNASEVVRDALRLHELYRNRVLEELRRNSKGLGRTDKYAHYQRHR